MWHFAVCKAVLVTVMMMMMMMIMMLKIMMMMMMLTMMMTMMMPGYTCCPVFFLMQCAGKSSDFLPTGYTEMQWTKHGANEASHYRISETILNYISKYFPFFKAWIRVGLKKNAILIFFWIKHGLTFNLHTPWITKRTKCVIMNRKNERNLVHPLYCVPPPIRIFSNILMHANWECGNIIFSLSSKTLHLRCTL